MWAILVALVAAGAAQLLPPPGDRDIRVVYWDLQKTTEVFLTLEPTSERGEPAPTLVFTRRFEGRRPTGPATTIEIRALAGRMWAPVEELVFVVNGEPLDLKGVGPSHVNFTDAGGWDSLVVDVPVDVLKRIAGAVTVDGKALGSAFVLRGPQIDAIRTFTARVLSEDPARP